MLGSSHYVCRNPVKSHEPTQEAKAGPRIDGNAVAKQSGREPETDRGGSIDRDR